MTEKRPSSQSVRDVLLASLPGHSDEDAHVVTYLLSVLDEAGYVVLPRDVAQHAHRAQVRALDEWPSDDEEVAAEAAMRDLLAKGS